VKDKTILITGGTGSFGKKLTEILLKEYRPKKLIIFSRDELKQHDMRQSYPDTAGSPMRYFIGDVRDRERLFRAFAGVDIVIHAAALKQVPACEYNPFEAVKTNVIGAENVIDAATDQGVKKVLALSTDKAANPVNIYGATKLCAEKLFVHGNSYSGKSGPSFSCTRYGNVVGSRGSVVLIFKKQRKTGKITVTDERMTRFWITIEEGVRFVIRCIDKMQGGEVFVPKIPSMRVMDLAKTIAPGCEIEITGIRPGEKLHEALISSDESRCALEFEDMYIIEPAQHWWEPDDLEMGKPLPDGFSYSSDTNDHWLTGEELLWENDEE
jgi:UDP-N-acetylglucosamine 4,6-dehydratase